MSNATNTETTSTTTVTEAEITEFLREMGQNPRDQRAREMARELASVDWAAGW